MKFLLNDPYQSVVEEKSGFHKIIHSRASQREDKQTKDRYIFDNLDSGFFGSFRTIWNKAYASCFNQDHQFLATILSPFVNPLVDFSVRYPAKILDVGCSSGFFLRQLNRNWEKYGCEVNRHACQIARSYNIKTQNRPFEKYVSRTKFDVVRASHVLEHLRSPNLFFAKATKILKKHGLLIVMTPNLDSVSRVIFKNNWSGYYDNSHYFIFTIDEIIKLAKQNGFNVVKTSSYYMGLSSVSLLRWLNFKEGEIFTLLFVLLYVVFLPFSFIENTLLKGDVIFIVFEKKR